jgi:hypothetical protein
MEASDIVNEFHRIVEKHLHGTPSVLTRRLIKKSIEDEVIMNNNVAEAISKIRITVKLFVDEKIAEDISKEMKQLMGL